MVNISICELQTFFQHDQEDLVFNWSKFGGLFGMKSFSRIVAIPKNYNQGFQMKYISIKIQNKQIPSAHSTSIAATFPFDSHRTLLGSGLEVLGSFFLAAEVVDFLAVGLLTCPSAGAPKLKKNVSYVK